MPLPGGTSDQRSAWPKGWQNVKVTWYSTALGCQMPLPGGTSELRLTGPNAVPLLATRCLYWGVCLSSGQPDANWFHSCPLEASTGEGVHLTKDQSDPKADKMSSWSDIVPLFATRCLYHGVCLSSGQLDPM